MKTLTNWWKNWNKMKHWSKNEKKKKKKKRGTWHPAMVETWNHWNSEIVASSGFHVYFRKIFSECMFMFVLTHAFFHRKQQKLIPEHFFPSVVFEIVSHPLRFYFSAGVKLDKNSIRLSNLPLFMNITQSFVWGKSPNFLDWYFLKNFFFPKQCPICK